MTDDGNCVCAAGTSATLLGGACVSLSVLLPAILCGLLGTAALTALAVRAWRRRRPGASRRLLGAARGTRAGQRDLPLELRKKYEAVEVLGASESSVVLRVWQRSGGGRRTAQRALKMVHARRAGRRFAPEELLVLDYEVRAAGN